MKFPLYTADINKTIAPSAGASEQIFSLEGVSHAKYGFNLDKAELNRTISNLTLECRLYDLPETNFPEELTTQILNEYEKNLILRDNEWKSTNRFHLEIIQRESPPAQWRSRGIISVVNRGSIPYYHPGFIRACKADAGVIYLGNTSQIAIKLIDIGGGLLRGIDKLIVSGTYRESAEVSELSDVVSVCVPYSFLVDGIGEKLLTIGSDVAFVRIFNNGSNKIWLNLSSLVGVGSGEPIHPNGSFVWTNDPLGDWRFLGDIYAIAEGTANVPMSAVVCYR